MKIILTGGGTAGHVTPNLALLNDLKKHFTEIHYLGSKQGIEKKIISQFKNIKYHEIPTIKLERKFTLKNIKIPFVLIKSIIQTKKILKQIKPDAIFSKGGYVAVPVVISGHKLNIPIIAHESDFSMGLANKLIYKYCKKMCVSFKNLCETYPDKTVFTGSPFREELERGNKANIINQFNPNPNLKTILFMGGSSGAKFLNELCWNNLERLTQKYNIIHIVGQNNFNINKKIKNYYQIEYSNSIEDIFAVADLVISRAGSNTIFELLCLKKLMILIPLPKRNSRGDQIENANYFKKNEFCKTILQEKVNIHLIISEINNTFFNEKFYKNNMKQYNNGNANKKIIDVILKNCINSKSKTKDKKNEIWNFTRYFNYPIK